MSNAPDDAAIERAIRELLDPLDRRFHTQHFWAGVGFVVLGPLVFFVVWLFESFPWWGALVIAVGVTVVLVLVLGGVLVGLESTFARRAMAQFNARFPPGSPGRQTAL